MHPDQFAKYAWADEIEAWTIAVISGATVERVVRVYGGDPARPVGRRSFADVRAERDARRGYRSVQVFEAGEHVVAIEPNHCSGTVPQVACGCSAGGGSFFSICLNANAAGDVTLAADGAITARFESSHPIAPANPDEVRPGWAIGPGTDVEVSDAVCLALMEQQTGLAIEEAWVVDPLPTYRVVQPAVRLPSPLRSLEQLATVATARLSTPTRPNSSSIRVDHRARLRDCFWTSFVASGDR